MILGLRIVGGSAQTLFCHVGHDQGHAIGPSVSHVVLKTDSDVGGIDAFGARYAVQRTHIELDIDGGFVMMIWIEFRR